MTRNSYIRTWGFTLMEVLVALVVISVGLIGIAAMQASAIASTHSSQSESLAAIEARSMADAMQANLGYWTTLAPPSFTVSAPAAGSSIGTVSDAALASQTTNCNTTACNATQLAGYDLQKWGWQLNTQVPGASAQFACTIASPSICTITVSWPQKATAALNSGTQSNATPTTLSYTLVNQF
jgi:type IV pilus assembly protein PilV